MSDFAAILNQEFAVLTQFSIIGLDSLAHIILIAIFQCFNSAN